MNKKIYEKKIKVDKNKLKWLIEPGCVILITTRNNDGVDNIATISWQTGIHSNNPTQFAIVLRPTRYSYKGIIDKNSFIINIPNDELLEEIEFCGTYSGRDINKFKKTNLTKGLSNILNLPYIKECIGHIECKVSQILDVLDHKIIISDFLEAWIRYDCFDGSIIPENARTVHYFGDHLYGTLDNRKKITIPKRFLSYE
ncbi:MAG: flavin reductase family protein [Cyanobacteria bacterium]|nr:flavin reductase family protein [Cyanobacteriota bacterium]